MLSDEERRRQLRSFGFRHGGRGENDTAAVLVKGAETSRGNFDASRRGEVDDVAAAGRAVAMKVKRRMRASDADQAETPNGFAALCTA